MRILLTKRSAASGLLVAVFLVFAPLLVAQDFGFEQSELESGLKLIVLPIKGIPRVECRIVYNVGSADDRPGRTGMAHFLEHMMFKGTDRLRAKNWRRERRELEELDSIAEELRAVEFEIQNISEEGRKPDSNLLRRKLELEQDFDAQQKGCDALIDGLQINAMYSEVGGSGVNASTSADLTEYKVSLPTNKLELFFYIESDRMTNSVFREFYKEKQVVLEERRRAIATGRRRISEQINAAVWEATPYRNPNLGWPSDVSAITRKQMFEYYRTYYVPNNAAVILTGDIGMETAKKLAEKYFGPIVRAPAPPRIYTRNASAATEKVLFAEMQDEPRVYINFSTVAAHHAHTHELDALANWLNSQSGPLYKKLVINEKLATTVEVAHWSMKHAGLFRIVAVAREEKVQEQLSQRIAEILDKVAGGEQGYAPGEDEIKAYAALIQRHLTRQLSASNSAAYLLGNSVFVGGVESIAKYVERSQQLKPRTICKIAKKYFYANNRVTLFVVAPRNEEEEIDSNIKVIAELIRKISEEEDEQRRRELERLVEKLRAKEEE